MSNSTPLNREQIEAHLLKRAGEDPAFRQTLLSNPRQALQQEVGLRIPENFELKVVEETSNSLYLVLPADHAELSDLELESMSGGQIHGSTLRQPTSVPSGGGGDARPFISTPSSSPAPAPAPSSGGGGGK